MATRISTFDDSRSSGAWSPTTNALRQRRERVLYGLVMRAALLVALVLGGLGLYERMVASTTPAATVASHVYVVKAGDTVFSIASRYCPSGDVQQYAFEIEQELGGSASIWPGERITLPAN